MLERRKTQRTRTFLGGTISFHDSYCVVDCLIREMSQNGARIVFTGTAIVPDQFNLQFMRQGRTRRVQLIWREADQVGVAFLDQAGVAGVVSLDQARKYRDLQAERDRLLSKVVELTSGF